MTTDPVVLALGKQILFVEIFLGIGRALNIVMVKVLIALGDVRTPVTVNVDVYKRQPARRALCRPP